MQSSHAELAAGLRAQGLEDVQVDDLHMPALGSTGRVDDYWASFEWSGGGMVHVHIALWMVGAPRIDKVIHAEEGADELSEAEEDTEEDNKY